MKRCSKCKKLKNETKFDKRRYTKDGLLYCCKDCRRERNRKYCGYLRKYLRDDERRRVVGGVKQKRCSKCRKWKAESDFYKKRRHKDGLMVWCKSCADKATNEARKQLMRN